MLIAVDTEERRALLAGGGDLAALARRLAERAAVVMARRPPIPLVKALLSVDGGVCPHDRFALEFDPWQPRDHRCPHCGRGVSGERHDRWWARFQHLWLAEQAATLAALAGLTGHAGAAQAAAGILSDYANAYFDFPNRDNVLGPSRLFFSTYLESIWITNYLAAAVMLRDAGLLDASGTEGVNTVADEAANVIGEFDEGFSNRQTWNNAALAAIAVWFEDEELGTRAVEGPTGIVAQLVRGFGEDGMWYEGENYHLFALRGQLVAMGWAKGAGADLLADAGIAARLASALRAPAETALPDLTFPARKDSRFGVSLAQPMYLELWEVGLARLGDPASDLWGWLERLYDSTPPRAGTFDSYLYDAGLPAPAAPRTRSDLSWWALLEMAPALPSDAPPWKPGPILLEAQGLAILRDGDRYASLECGPHGGGHGHPDKLHLTVHAAGHHWLADPGTGSYVDRDLFWYRSTLAHNAPRLDGVDQPPADAWCSAFHAEGAWGWAQGVFNDLTRTLVAGPSYLLDIVELAADRERVLELPWHPEGEVEILSPGTWSADVLAGEFVAGAERLADRGDGSVRLRARIESALLELHLVFDGDLLRAQAPGRPGGPGPSRFFLVRTRARNARLIAVVDTSSRSLVRAITVEGPAIMVETTSGVDRHLPVGEGWQVSGGGEIVRLGGVRKRRAARGPLIDHDRRTPPRATAIHIGEPPALDGSLDTFDAGEPILLDHEDQYRRSEEAYAGPEEFSATALINWDSDAIYLGIDVVKSEVVYRPNGAPPLRLDNEADDLHSDGLQVYLRMDGDGPVYGFLVVPADEDGSIRASVIQGYAGNAGMVTGGWTRTQTGYAITLAVGLPDWSGRPRDEIAFDLIINELRSDRVRRAGQLVWSGGGGWVFLRGDRQPAGSFGVLELR